MNKYKLSALLALAFLVGDATAITRANHAIKASNKRHEREMQTNRQSSFEAGWNASIESPARVKAAYRNLFGHTSDISLN